MNSTDPKPALVPYYLIDEKKVCPYYFNHKRYFGPPGFKEFKKDQVPKPSDAKSVKEIDPFEVNKWLPDDDPDRISAE